MEPAGQPPRPGTGPSSNPPVPAGSGAEWVLVCDDTASIRLLIRINLELAGFEVIEATDGAAALALLHRNPDRPPSVVVLDAQMRPLDGWGAISAIRADPALVNLPVIMVTAALQQREEERSAAVGVDIFLAKPFDPDDLVDLVQDLARHGRPRDRPPGTAPSRPWGRPPTRS